MTNLRDARFLIRDAAVQPSILKQHQHRFNNTQHVIIITISYNINTFYSLRLYRYKYNNKQLISVTHFKIKKLYYSIVNVLKSLRN